MVEFRFAQGTGGRSRVNVAQEQRELAQLDRRRRADARRIGPPQFNPEADALFGFFGASRQLSGNAPTIRNDDGSLAQVGSVAERFAGAVPQAQLSDEQQSALGQFFSPTVTDDQNAQLRRIATISAGQGIFGGAIRGQLQDASTNFIGRNRAAAFDTVSPLIRGGLDQLVSNVSPFLSQAGLLNSTADFRSTGQAGLALLGASGGTRQSFEELGAFASPALQALQAFGLGGDALFGLADAAGVNIGAGGTTGRGDIGSAFRDFVNPTAGGVEDFLGVNSPARRNAFRAANRLSGLNVLQNEIRGRLDEVLAGAADFDAESFGTDVLEQGGFSGAQQIANADLSRFAPILSQLGVTPRTPSNQAGNLTQQGATLVPDQDLFRRLIGG